MSTQSAGPKIRKATVLFEDSPGKSKAKPHQKCGTGVGLAKMTTKQLQTWHNEIRANLPTMSFNEIRRHQLTYEKSMFLEMSEEGYGESADYIAKLIQMHRDMRAAAGPGTLLWQRERLRDSAPSLEALRKGLCAAQHAINNDKPREQCAALLALSIKFMHGDDGWWWIAEQLFETAVEAAQKYKGDGSRGEAVARYTYGHFLLQHLEEIDGAEQQLQLARALSEGHDWTADEDAVPEKPAMQTHQRRFSKVPQLPIFVETCRLLYKTLLLMAMRIRESDADEAIRLCKQALKRAEEAQKKEAVAEVLYELGLGYQVLGDQETAISVFEQHYDLCTELNDYDGMCNAHMQTAQCHQKLGNADETLQHLERFRRCADKKRLVQRLAEAHRYLGEYHLYQESPDRARMHLNASFGLYFKLKQSRDVEEVRCLACIAEGQSIMPMYSRLVLDSHDPRKMRRLVKWKDSHAFFWIGSAHRIASHTASTVSSTPSVQSTRHSVVSDWSLSQSAQRHSNASQRHSNASQRASLIAQRHSLASQRPFPITGSKPSEGSSNTYSFYSDDEEEEAE